MTGLRLAVIDLGSNTFHLLICEVNRDGTWSTILKKRSYVKLARSGLDNIEPVSIQRAQDTLIDFSKQIQAFQVQYTQGIGTSVLREAKNGAQVAQQLSDVSGIPIEIIDGQKEADYILFGIQACIPTQGVPCLIMDIGGGSVEFILYREEETLFKGSYKIGVAHLFNTYHKTDPISESSIRDIEQLLEKELSELQGVLRSTGRFYLIGASGSFEVMQDVMPKIQDSAHWSELDIRNLPSYLEEIIRLDLGSRRKIPEIPIERLDYIVVAYILTRYVLTMFSPDKLFYSEYALKEGVVEEMIKKHNF